eukprot:Gb_26899 [translate_table: standard]
MSKFQLGVFLIFVILSAQALASRFVVQEKNQLLVPKTNPSKAGQEASHQHSDEIVQCEWKAGKASSTHREHRPLKNCEDALNRQFEDGDYIYTNARP